MKSRSQHTALFWPLILLALFNTIDYFATQDLVTYGEHGELNPLMDRLLGTPYFTLYKMILIPLGLLYLWFVRKHVVGKYLRLVWVTCALYSLLMFYTWTVFYL